MPAGDINSTHPDVRGSVIEALVRCIDECYACAQACTACADACLAEDMVQQLKQCIRLNLDCADVCAATVPRHRGAPAPTSRSCVRCCRWARPPARCAARSASAMLGSTSTAGSPPRLAVGPSRLARRRAGRRLGCSCASIDAKRLGATSDGRLRLPLLTEFIYPSATRWGRHTRAGRGYCFLRAPAPQLDGRCPAQ
jgi:hypothetical protein